MKEKKYVLIGGYAFLEKNDMKKLKNLAKQGWLIDGVVLPILCYRFKKGEPKNLDFAVDYQKNVGEDYFSLFKSAGWKHELTLGDELHLFSAPEGIKPIYTDNTSKFDNLETIAGKFKVSSIYSLIIFTSLIIISRFLQEINIIYYILITISFVAVIFTSLPYLGYKYKLKKMRKN
ncbi:DUF2812 domain-containing protein [Proteinivorax tanatarense]|uniref:DUF2812 domain-containing protein n=1 Tax=Proteinivorax tanatarense TaxID=1260629 RepID=A0AAU7VJY0_9FIRM